MNRTSECFFDQATMPGPQLLATSDRAARRITRLVVVCEYVLGKMTQRTRVRDDARRAKTLQLAMICVESRGRQTHRVEPSLVGNESLVTLAQRIGPFWIEMRAPEKGSAAAFANSEYLEEAFHPAAAPATFVWS